MSSNETVPGLNQLEAEVKLVEQGVTPDQIADYREEIDSQAERCVAAFSNWLAELAEEGGVAEEWEQLRRATDE